jgi:hypothetical protein
MLGSIFSFVAGLLGKVLGSLFGKKDPTPVELAASNATAQTELVEQETASAIVEKASIARANADARVVRVVSGGSGSGETPGADRSASVNAELRKQFPGDFRD